MGGGLEPHKPVHEPTTDSRTGEDEAWRVAVHAAPCHRSGLDARGLPADAQGWRARRRRRHGVTAADYEANLEGGLVDLLGRLKSGRYHAPPVRRAYLPKADGSQRMLGIPT